MKAKRKYSIFVKTQGYLVVFCVALLLLVWFFETLFFSVKFSRYQMDTVKSIADYIMKMEVNDDKIENIAYENNVCIAQFDAYGDVRSYNIKMNGCNIKDPQSKDVIYSFLNSKKNKVFKTLEFASGNRGYIYGVRNGENEIFIYSPLEDHNVASTLIKSQLVYVIFVAIILSCAIALYISSRITKPIRELTKKAVNIGKEKYNNYFEETGIKEIDELSESLDEAQESLSKMQTYQKDLLANISHDLKTPLTMIKAYAEKIRDISYKDKKKLDSDIEVITSEADRLSLLVSDILSLSKMQNNADLFVLEEYDLVKEIKGILKKYEIIKEAEKYEFIVDLPDEVIIKADRAKINQVIYNLINNAINYTGDDKKVYISLKKENKEYVFSVRDTGKGIKKSEIKNIWTKYYKNDKNHKRNVVSTGIGLSIVKEILEKHGFVYGVISREREGAIFYFKVPYKEKKLVHK